MEPPRIDAAAAQPILPLALEEHVAAVLAGASAHAFAERRAAQLLDFGHTVEDDLARPIDYLARAAGGRIADFLSLAGHGHLEVTADIRDRLLRKLDVAGALLLAARDRVAAAPIIEHPTAQGGTDHE